MEQSESINELAKALCEAQKETLFALKDSNNPFFKSKYADLSSVWDAARVPLTKNGLSVLQTMNPGENGTVIIVTTLMHTSGQWVKSFLPVRPVKDDPQSVGSAITYGRRYGLQAIVGICPEDDDGEKSMGRKQTTQQAAKPETRTQEQANKIMSLGEERGLSKKETADVLKWFFKGRVLTKDEADFVINGNFDQIVANYAEREDLIRTEKAA